MKIKIKLSGAFDQYPSFSINELDEFYIEEPVPVKTVLKKLMIPDDQPKLILINGMVKKQSQLLQDGDTLSIFPTMSGG